MKKLFAIIFLLAISIAMYGQSTSPRFGTLKNQDNTGRVLTFKTVSLTDAVGVDTLSVNPNAYTTYVKIALVDSLTIKPVVTNSYYGDQLIILCTATTGTPFLKFTGSNWLTAGKATLSTNLRAVIRLTFDGAKWVETGRYVQ